MKFGLEVWEGMEKAHSLLRQDRARTHRIVAKAKSWQERVFWGGLMMTNQVMSAFYQQYPGLHVVLSQTIV